MNRREFARVLGISGVALSLGKAHASVSKAHPQISITMDDFFWENSLVLTGAQRNAAILSTLDAHNIKAALFVVGRNLEKDEGKQLLSAWDKAGHLIGNHTYSHRDFANPQTTLAGYEEDILRADALLKNFRQFKRYFRYPMLREGESVAKRDGLRTFLSQHDYKMGYVTIDNSEWIVETRLSDRLRDNPKADTKPYREYYLEHMWDRAQYYDQLAQKVAGRPVAHTILIHFNLLNALFLDDLIRMFKSKGWEWIDAEKAFADPVFSKKPNILPAGQSIVWALAKENGTIPMSESHPPAEHANIQLARMKKAGL